jgi:hypothetical protein
MFDLLWLAIGFNFQILCDHLPDFSRCLQSDFIEWAVNGDFDHPVCDLLHHCRITQPALSACPANELQVSLDDANWLILAQYGPYPVRCLKIHALFIASKNCY